MCSDMSGMLSWFHRYFDLSDSTQFCWVMGLCMQAHSVHACKLACLGQILCSERYGIFSWIHIYFDLSNLTKFGWDISLYMQSYSVDACKLACLGQSMCSERSDMFSWFHRYFDISDLTKCNPIVCMHASLRAWVKICTQRGPACSKDILIFDLTQIGWDMGLCAQGHRVHAC